MVGELRLAGIRMVLSVWSLARPQPPHNPLSGPERVAPGGVGAVESRHCILLNKLFLHITSFH